MRFHRFCPCIAAALVGAALLWAGNAGAASLKETVQAKLDASPCLAQQELKLRVVQEMRGSVTLELNQGSKTLRDLFRKGIEMDGAGMRDAALKEEDLKSLRCIRNTLKTVKQIKGVTDISLTGAINPLDPAENDYNQACQQMTQGTPTEREEAIPILLRSAEAGFPAAQTDLASYYLVGGGVEPNERKAGSWYRKAAENGEPRAEYNLARMLSKGAGMTKDYGQAIQWYRKAASQDRQMLPKIKSLNSLALLLATCPQEKLRDGKAAAECIEQVERLDPQNPALFEVRAAINAQCGRFPEAVEQQKKWIETLEATTNYSDSEKEARLDKARKSLELYQSNHPDIEAEASPSDEQGN